MASALTTPAQDVQTLLASPAILALLQQLQAQILLEAGTADAASRGADTIPAGAVVLMPIAPDGEGSAPWRCDGVKLERSQGEFGHKPVETFRRRLACPEGWVSSRVPWHPSHWRHYERRVDSEGQQWERASGRIHVVDDYGFLVPLPEAFQ